MGLSEILGIINLVAVIVVAVLVFKLQKSTDLTSGTIDKSAISNEIRSSATSLKDDFSRANTELRNDFAIQRSELQSQSSTTKESLTEQLNRNENQLQTRLQEIRVELDKKLLDIQTVNETKLTEIRSTIDQKIETTLVNALKNNSEKIELLTKEHKEQQLQLVTAQHESSNALKESLSEELVKIQQQVSDNVSKMRTQLNEELETLRQSNENKLEQMRNTVDEKLQGTLERRLGESFKQVSERLEQVHKGLGEMQNLATDVGGLKRVLTNVKTRGTWGEVQLHRQLDDLLTQDQYLANVKIKENSGDNVEFAVKLPGRGEAEHILLPIDSKLPQEDYDRLLLAQEEGDKAEVELMARKLDQAIEAQAKTISSKYIDVPKTTDFAIMYLPTEGLFAEVIRRPGLATKLQNQHRVIITGPTTLMSLLNSLQMGFKTLAIEKRSSEVWQLLGAAKTEFSKYGLVMDKLQKQLTTAQNTVSEVGTRTRAIERRLKTVESIEATEATSILELPGKFTTEEE